MVLQRPLEFAMHNRALELKDYTLGIVDNDPLVLDLLTHYFVASHAPLHVLWSLNNPKQAWRACNDERTRPQVVLTDIEMPGMNGRELFHRIRAHEPNIVVIGVAAFPDAVEEPGLVVLPRNRKSRRSCISRACCCMMSR